MEIATINTAPAVLFALDALAKRDGQIADALARYGYPPNRIMAQGYESLAKIIVGQQISRIVASSIWQKLDQAGWISAATIATLSVPDMQTKGLSKRKAEYLIGAAQAVTSGALDMTALADAPPEEVRTKLVALRGIGNWTADNYRLFALGDMDAWPGNDIALQEGMRRLKGLANRPTYQAMEELALPWAPYRGAGALFLWHLYGIEVRKAAPSDIGRK